MIQRSVILLSLTNTLQLERKVRGWASLSGTAQGEQDAEKVFRRRYARQNRKRYMPYTETERLLHSTPATPATPGMGTRPTVFSL